LIKLFDIESNQIGEFHRAEASKKFGVPNEIVTLPYSDHLEAWLYIEQPYNATKVSLIFEKGTGVLQRKTWFVSEGEPEIDIQAAKARYPAAQFEARLANGRNPHVIS